MKTLRYLFPIFFVSCFTASLAAGDAVAVKSNSDFITIANEASKGSFSFDIQLETDLDFDDQDLHEILDKLPLGTVTTSTCTPYSGTFDGKGHTVKNLHLNRTGASGTILSGLICDVSNAVIKNIIIDASCSFYGDIVGGVSSRISGNVTIHNVRVNAFLQMHGQQYGDKSVGGFFGEATNKSGISIVIHDCEFGGTIIYNSSDIFPFCGCFVGFISSCSDSYIFIKRNCLYYA